MAKLIIPTPVSVTVSHQGPLMLFDTTWTIYNKVNEYSEIANYLKGNAFTYVLFQHQLDKTL